jgi:hypothetical protein
LEAAELPLGAETPADLVFPFLPPPFSRRATLTAARARSSALRARMAAIRSRCGTSNFASAAAS